MCLLCVLSEENGMCVLCVLNEKNAVCLVCVLREPTEENAMCLLCVLGSPVRMMQYSYLACLVTYSHEWNVLFYGFVCGIRGGG